VTATHTESIALAIAPKTPSSLPAAHHTHEAAINNTHAPNQFVARRSSRESTSRPNRSKCSSRLNIGAAVQER